MEKPPTEALTAGEDLHPSTARSQQEIHAFPDLPATPVTPVTAEAFMSLHNFILEQHAQASDYVEKQGLQRHLLKLTKAAQSSIVRSTLQQEQIQFLRKINNEGKVRRAERSTVLGKARVMSYEDLEGARKKRLEKESSIATTKSKRARKRKAQDEAEALPDGSIAVTESRIEGDTLAPCPGNAPAAQMW